MSLKHQLEILFEDNHLIAINKKAGWLTHGDETGDESATEKVKQYIKVKYNKPGAVFLNPVHRIDRPVSGVLLFAKTSKATSRMVEQFKHRDPQKVYAAITNKAPKQFEGELTHYLKKNGKANIVYATNKKDSGSKHAQLYYKMVAELQGNILLRVEPKTGRSHQIRVQLSEMGCPIIGDLKYNSNQKTDGKSIGLHAYSLTFEHPVKKEEMVITAHFPTNEIWQSFKSFERELKG